MAFIDNSGDIILDAVLTDTGRMRLAKGDGTFRVVKFALGDDEIDYKLYNKDHPSGSAYYDLEIMQTPILEAFTNNASFLKSKLLTLPRNDFTFLPSILVNNLSNGAGTQYAIPELVQNGYVLAVDETTENFFANNSSLTYKSAVVNNRGILQGFDTDTSNKISLEQGLNTTEIPQREILDPSLKEQQYIIEFDSKFGSIAADRVGPLFLQTPSYIDDDGIATYFFSSGVDTDFVSDIPLPNQNNTNSANRVIRGPVGTMLKFRIKSSLGVQTSDYLFENLGSSMDISSANGFQNYSSTVTSARQILTILRISGVTTGASVDVPILLVKVK